MCINVSIQLETVASSEYCTKPVTLTSESDARCFLLSKYETSKSWVSRLKSAAITWRYTISLTRLFSGNIVLAIRFELLNVEILIPMASVSILSLSVISFPDPDSRTLSARGSFDNSFDGASMLVKAMNKEDVCHFKSVP